MTPIPSSVFLSALLVSLLALAAGPGFADEAFRAGPGGLRIKDLQTGQGPQAEAGMVATIHFIGWLDNGGARGREIYNSRAAGQPVSYLLGTDGVMQAWNAGVMGMRPGGARMLLVPPSMAYGNRSVEGVIPPNAPMMFRIELIRLESPSGS
jgi:FKBP-type peptidyl-prolyl cis-trans isomerase FkpA